MALGVELTSKSGALTSVTGATFAHTVTAATKLVFTGGMGNSPVASATFSGVTWNTTENFNLVGRKNDTNFETTEVWELPNTATGTHNIVATVTGGGTVAQLACGVSGVTGNPQTTVGSPSNATATTDNPSLTVVDTAADDLVFYMLASDLGPGGTTTPGGTQLWEEEDVASDSDFNAQSVTATGANTVGSWTASQGGNKWAAIGFAVKSSGGGVAPGLQVTLDKLTVFKRGNFGDI